MARSNAVCGGLGLLAVLLIITARQMYGQHRVEKSDGGAPLQVVERVVEQKNDTAVSSSSIGSTSRKRNKTIAAAWDEKSNSSNFVKPKKVFEGSSNKAYMPGEAIVPEGGMRVSASRHLAKLVHAKCTSLIGFYNSRDKEKSELMTGVWNEFFYAEMGKFEFGLCDVRKTTALEVAVEAGFFNGTFADVELPAVLAFPSRDMLNESVVVLDNLGSAKTSKMVKNVFNVVDNLELTLSKDGCYSKLKIPISDEDVLRQSASNPPTSSTRPFSIGSNRADVVDTATEMTNFGAA